MTAAPDRLVTFKDGSTMPVSIFLRLLELERAGVRFRLLGQDRIRVSRRMLLTDDDLRFLRAHRDLVRQILSFEAADIASAT